MMKSLSAEQQEFFQLVSKAAFSNPFSEERDATDRELAEGGDPGDVLGRLLVRLRERLAGLHPSHFRRADRELVEHAVLFDVFHRFVDPLDSLIRDQQGSDEGSLPVPFANEMIGELEARGVARARAARALPIFYQMRRAFFFIDESLVGSSPSMMKLRESLWNNVFTKDILLYESLLWNRMEDFSTIIVGETGSGKGSAAAAIGRSGFIPFDAKRGYFAASFTESFVPINLSQFSEALIESELFGHKKGAFTGAVDAHEGVFSRCSAYGSIFLDEIGEVGSSLQIKLLRVLQERTFSPVGSHEVRRFSGRVIAATHRPLDELRASGQMRADFFYRLCSDVVLVPPLRQRIAESSAELPMLVARVVARAVGEESSELSTRVMEAIDRDLGAAYAWPGNVRELEQCVRRVLLTGSCLADQHGGRAKGTESLLDHAVRTGTASARQLLNLYCALLYERAGTYEAVARITGLDRRTVKRHIAERAEEAEASGT